MFSSQDEISAYRASLNSEAPDLCEIVLYKGKSWRVSSWHCPIVEVKPSEGNVIGSIVWDLSAKEREAAIKKGTARTRYCERHEATHVSLVSVCGTTARIDQVERTGTFAWDKECKEEAIQQQKVFCENWSQFPCYYEKM